MKIGIIGTGVFSVSIANLLAQNTKNKIVLWSENKELVTNYNKTGRLSTICKDKTLPKNIAFTSSFDTVLKDVDLVLIMTSITYVESVCFAIKDKINKIVPVCIGTKGITIYNGKPKFAYEIVKRILKNPLAIMSGPTFSEDVFSLAPIAFTVACKSRKTKVCLNKVFFSLETKLVYTSDFRGVSISGCVKNIYAIGSGILAGLGYKESTIAFYLTCVYKELETILYGYDSSLDTLHSLAGFGDLVATCSSIKSRNYILGLMVGKNKNQRDINSFVTKNTVEGLNSLDDCAFLLTRKHIKAPIIMVISKIINKEKSADELLQVLKDMKLNSIY